MSNADPLELDSLNPVLAGIIRDNMEKVAGWMSGQPGCWGFLAGKAVVASRAQLVRSLTEGERRLVWNRLWWWLEQLKARALC